MNKALLDTDILSEVSTGINPIVVGNANTYRKAHGFLTLSVISVMEAIQGYQRMGATTLIQAFRNAIASEEVLLFDQDAADLAGQIAGNLPISAWCWFPPVRNSTPLRRLKDWPLKTLTCIPIQHLW